MGGWSGGKPSCSGLSNLKELLQNTRDEYQKFNPNFKQWPCPFCIIKSKTLIQCRIHIFKDHAGSSGIIPGADKNGFFSNFKTPKQTTKITTNCTNNVNINDNRINNLRPKLVRKCKEKEMSNINHDTPKDLTEFLNLVDDSNTANSFQSEEINHISQDTKRKEKRVKKSIDETCNSDAIFSCEHCPNDQRRSFKSLKGLKIHITKSHQDIISNNRGNY